MKKKQENLNNLLLRLSAVSVDAVLKRGFAWIKDNKGRTIYNTSEARTTDGVEIKFYDGKVKANIENAASKSPKKVQKNNEKQISLFDF